MKKQKISSIGSDKSKAARYIIIGLIVAVIFGVLIGISKSLAANAGTWESAQIAVYQHLRDIGAIGEQDLVLKTADIHYWADVMVAQEIFVTNIARIGVSIGLVLITIGFIGFAINDSLDERTRRASLVLAAVVMFVLIVTTFFTNISIDIT